MNRLRRFQMVYLSTPYTLYPKGHEIAFRDAAKLAGRLLLAGVKIFSPVVKGHALAVHTPIDKLDHEFWMDAYQWYLKNSEAILIGKLDGWDNSRGIAEETGHARAAGKPVFLIEPDTLKIESGDDAEKIVVDNSLFCSRYNAAIRS